MRFCSLLLALLGIAGCTRVVDLDLDEGPRRLVVDARLELRTDGNDRQLFRLTTTDPFDSGAEPPTAQGAIVTVADELGSVVTFQPASVSGIEYYVGSLVPRLGGRYTLTIDYQGERYRATHQVLAVPPIDSLYFVYEEEGLAQGDSGFRAVIDYQDPAGVKNYYLWRLFVNGERRGGRDPGNRFRVISDDRFYDGGKVIGYQPYDEEVVEPGDQVEMTQVALSETGFRYYFALYEQTSGSGGPFSTPPASVRGNIANLTDPSHYPLGFFSASQVASRRAVVPVRR